MAGPPKANSIASGSRPSLAPATATAQPPHPMIEIDGPDGNPANPCLVGATRHRVYGGAGLVPPEHDATPFPRCATVPPLFPELGM